MTQTVCGMWISAMGVWGLASGISIAMSGVLGEVMKKLFSNLA